MALFFQYLWTVGLLWVPVVTVGLGGVANVMIPSWREFAERKGFNKSLRRDVLVVLFCATLLWAGFAAWEAEYLEHQKTAADLVIANQTITRMQPKGAPQLPPRDGLARPAVTFAPARARHDVVSSKPIAASKGAAPQPAATFPAAPLPTAPVVGQVARSPYQAPASRSLTIEQQKILIAALSPLSGRVERSQCSWVPGDYETLNLCNQFIKVFQLAGLKPESVTENPQNPSELGIMIEQGPNTPKDLVAELKSALSSVGITAKVIKRTFAGSPQLYIYVGPQPL